MAKLYFRYGAMNSGKSTILLQTAYNYKERGMDVCILKPSRDSKAEDNVSSRIGIEKKVDILFKSEDNLFELISKKHNISCVLIDEAQFMTRDQANQCMEVTTKLDIPVICYGLRTDFLTNGFPGSTRLLEIAHTIEEMKTICACGRKAIYNARFVSGQMVTEGEQIAIDGKDETTYVSMCAKCYEQSKSKILTKRKRG